MATHSRDKEPTEHGNYSEQNMEKQNLLAKSLPTIVGNGVLLGVVGLTGAVWKMTHGVRAPLFWGAIVAETLHGTKERVRCWYEATLEQNPLPWAILIFILDPAEFLVANLGGLRPDGNHGAWESLARRLCLVNATIAAVRTGMGGAVLLISPAALAVTTVWAWRKIKRRHKLDPKKHEEEEEEGRNQVTKLSHLDRTSRAHLRGRGVSDAVAAFVVVSGASLFSLALLGGTTVAGVLDAHRLAIRLRNLTGAEEGPFAWLEERAGEWATALRAMRQAAEERVGKEAIDAFRLARDGRINDAWLAVKKAYEAAVESAPSGWQDLLSMAAQRALFVSQSLLGAAGAAFGRLLAFAAFMASLFHCLRAQSSPSDVIARALASGTDKQEVASVIRSGVRAAVIPAVRLAVLHGLFAALLGLAFGSELMALLPSGAALLSVVPAAPPFAVSVILAIELIARGRSGLLAVVAPILHAAFDQIAMAASRSGDLTLASSHPHLVPMFTVGGMRTFRPAAQGALLGPLILSLVSLVPSLLASLLA